MILKKNLFLALARVPEKRLIWVFGEIGHFGGIYAARLPQQASLPRSGRSCREAAVPELFWVKIYF